MTNVPYYVGNSPYCYTNSLTMLFGFGGPSNGVVDTLTGSAFGFQLLLGRLPFFDPLGWTPETGMNQAVDLLGYECERHTHASEDEALAGLRAALADGPVFVGPVDMGMLPHQAGGERFQGNDHFLLVLEVADELVRFHDAQGHPYATLPHQVFLDAWRADRIPYHDGRFALRTGLRRTREVRVEEAMEQLVPLAREWARGRDLPVPPGTIGGAEGYRAAAELARSGARLPYEMLAHFGLPVGARRRHDAATNMRAIGQTALADALEAMSMTLGGMQLGAMTEDPEPLAQGLDRLAEQYEDLLAAF